MLLLPPNLRNATERQHAGEFVFLWDIEVERRTKLLPPVVIRMTSQSAPQLWTVPECASPVTFYPFGFAMTDIEQDQDGNLPSLELAIDNTGRTLMRHLHDADGFEGNRATLYMSHRDALAAGEAVRFDFTVQTAVASNDAITARLEISNLNEVRLPSARFIQATCRWAFGSRECGYPITALAAFTTCNKTVPDCGARGDDEEARGLPRLHPLRFGAWPGIATQRQ